MSMQEAIQMVGRGEAQRIATPGKWKVWREGETVKHEVLRK